MNHRLFGGIMMITGTCIGAGMLALPVATALNDLVSSSLLMLVCWCVMTLGALFILEVNLALPAGANLISMAKATIGRGGAAMTWLCTLLLMYALLSAYITGGAQITIHWLQDLHLPHTQIIGSLVFTILLGGIVLCGIHWVDWSNRGLMSVKLAALVLLLFAIFPHVTWPYASSGSPHQLLSATTVIITSFGFGTIIPSLRVYFKNDAIMLKKAIIIGSLIPLLLYLAWNIAVHSVLPDNGPQSLAAMQQSGNASSQLADALIMITQSSIIKVFANIFTSICVLTSFLGVALSLSDFLADGTSTSKKHWQGLSLNAIMTFALPLAIALFYPRAFIVALQYAGLCCLILLSLLPVMMAWGARRKRLSTTYQVQGGKGILLFGMLCSILALTLSIIPLILGNTGF